MNVNQILSSVPQENMTPRLTPFFKVDVKTPLDVFVAVKKKKKERESVSYSTGSQRGKMLHGLCLNTGPKYSTCDPCG